MKSTRISLGVLALLALAACPSPNDVHCVHTDNGAKTVTGALLGNGDSGCTSFYNYVEQENGAQEYTVSYRICGDHVVTPGECSFVD